MIHFLSHLQEKRPHWWRPLDGPSPRTWMLCACALQTILVWRRSYAPSQRRCAQLPETRAQQRLQWWTTTWTQKRRLGFKISSRVSLSSRVALHRWWVPTMRRRCCNFDMTSLAGPKPMRSNRSPSMTTSWMSDTLSWVDASQLTTRCCAPRTLVWFGRPGFIDS